MADYTLKNLREVEDASAKFGISGMEARFARKALDCKLTGLAYEKLSPNFRTPFGHKHAQQEEIYVLVSGSARAKLEDDIVELKPWDALRVHGDTMRSFEAGAEGAEIIAFGAPTSGENDSEVVPGWWSD